MSLLYNRNDLIAYIRTVLMPLYQSDATMYGWLRDTADYLESRKITTGSRRHIRNLADNGIRYCTDRGYWNLAQMIEVCIPLLEVVTIEGAAVPRFVEQGYQ